MMLFRGYLDQVAHRFGGLISYGRDMKERRHFSTVYTRVKDQVGGMWFNEVDCRIHFLLKCVHLSK